ncbi:MAG: hypothetical protein MK085_02905 [Phycisphaerales bacterium]|nr:hypothetical protein [Phycisphaerales bacterium]
MSRSTPPTSPLGAEDIVARYFLEHRAKLIDIAAFLDRVERARDGESTAANDFRMQSLRGGIDILLDGEPERARRVLDLLSDPSDTPIDKAPMKGATGAWEAFDEEHSAS